MLRRISQFWLRGSTLIGLVALLRSILETTAAQPLSRPAARAGLNIVFNLFMVRNPFYITTRLFNVVLDYCCWFQGSYYITIEPKSIYSSHKDH